MWNVSIFYFNSTPLEKRKRHNYRLSNPTLIERALLIQEISSSLILPIYFFNRLLSIVVICSNNAIDGMDNAEWELSWQWVGILALWWICPVITATITVHILTPSRAVTPLFPFRHYYGGNCKTAKLISEFRKKL